MAHKRFLIVGRTGMGKSSMVNSAFGRVIAETADFEACTRLVTYHAYGTDWGDLELIDTPGFAEGGSQDDQRVIELIANGANVARLDAVLLVTRLDETRMRPDEARMIDLLTARFGEAFWLKAWLMMTFAATVPEESRAESAVAREGPLIDTVQDAIIRHRGDCRFDGFQHYWMVDNVVCGWSHKSVPLALALSLVH